MTDTQAMETLEPTCLICGCTEENPCRLEVDTCAWRTTRRDLCTNPKCIVAHANNLKAAKLARRLVRESAVKPIRNRFDEARRKRREEETARRARGYRPVGS